MYRWLCMALLALVTSVAAADAPAKDSLVFEDTFDKGLEHWDFTDAKAWKTDKDGDRSVMALTGSSNYKPAVRSPLNIAWAKGVNVGDFTLEATVRQTGKEYGHRDLCFFFGKQDATHFYYVHLATKADDHANSIFIVDGKPRLSIAKERTTGTDWATGYHKVRVVRSTATGRIEVYFDDMAKPVMTAEDKTFLSGPVGLGSFDDTGNFDEIHVWGKAPAK